MFRVLWTVVSGRALLQVFFKKIARKTVTNLRKKAMNFLNVTPKSVLDILFFSKYLESFYIHPQISAYLRKDPLKIHPGL